VTEPTPEPTPEVTHEPTPEVTPEPTPEVTPEVTPEPVVEKVAEPVVEKVVEPEVVPKAIDDDFSEEVPASIYLQPKIMPQLVQQSDETDAYMQVLQAMMRQQETQEKLPGLNGATQKLLDLNNMYMNNFKAKMTSDSTTINTISQDFSKEVFGGDYDVDAPLYTMKPPFGLQG
jgi:hypothetical protein